MAEDSSVTVVVAARNGCAELRRSLARHQGPVIVIDNGSTDQTLPMIAREFPAVQVVPLPRNDGATARNLGAALASTPYVAFADDDSWWEPGALETAAGLFEAYPRLGLIAGRVLVGGQERLDDVSRLMAQAPLGTEPDLPGPSVLGFLACAAIVRRQAFLTVGGFDDVVFFFGEEERVALDLVTAGWGLAYVDGVIAHHYPQPVPEHRARIQLAARNRLLTAVMRRPWPVVVGTAWQLCRSGPAQRRGLLAAARRVPRAVRRRSRLSPRVEGMRRKLDEC
jgi:GT2 family glycosyltransferase